MPRSRATVAVATAVDVPHLVELWRHLPSGVIGPRCGDDEMGMAARFAAVLCESRCVLLLARYDGVPAGMTMLTFSPVTLLSDTPTAHLDYTIVAAGFRRRGVGRALMAAAAEVAADAGAEQLVASVAPMSREANRFFARLGFSPAMVLRSAPVSGLRRRLAALEPDARARDVVSVRRSRTVAHTRVRAALHRIAVTAPVPTAITLPDAGSAQPSARR